MMKKLISFFKDEDGVTAIEYGLIAALIAVVIIVALVVLGEALRDKFSYIASEVVSAGSS